MQGELLNLAALESTKEQIANVNDANVNAASVVDIVHSDFFVKPNTNALSNATDGIKTSTLLTCNSVQHALNSLHMPCLTSSRACLDPFSASQVSNQIPSNSSVASSVTTSSDDKSFNSQKVTLSYLPVPLAPKYNVIVPPYTNGSSPTVVHHSLRGKKLRSGKWLDEEEEYAELIICLFERGDLLDCSHGMTLRAYLSQKLHCAPMRISKKYAGKGIGKMQYNRKKHFAPSILCNREAVEFQLMQAEEKFVKAALLNVDQPPFDPFFIRVLHAGGQAPVVLPHVPHPSLVPRAVASQPPDILPKPQETPPAQTLSKKLSVPEMTFPPLQTPLAEEQKLGKQQLPPDVCLPFVPQNFLPNSYAVPGQCIPLQNHQVNCAYTPQLASQVTQNSAKGVLTGLPGTIALTLQNTSRAVTTMKTSLHTTALNDNSSNGFNQSDSIAALPSFLGPLIPVFQPSNVLAIPHDVTLEGPNTSKTSPVVSKTYVVPEAANISDESSSGNLLPKTKPAVSIASEPSHPNPASPNCAKTTDERIDLLVSNNNSATSCTGRSIFGNEVCILSSGSTKLFPNIRYRSESFAEVALPCFSDGLTTSRDRTNSLEYFAHGIGKDTCSDQLPDLLTGFDQITQSKTSAADLSNSDILTQISTAPNCPFSPTYTSRSFDDLHRFLGKGLSPVEKIRNGDLLQGDHFLPSLPDPNAPDLFSAESFALFAKEATLMASEHAASLALPMCVDTNSSMYYKDGCSKRYSSYDNENTQPTTIATTAQFNEAISTFNLRDRSSNQMCYHTISSSETSSTVAVSEAASVVESIIDVFDEGIVKEESGITNVSDCDSVEEVTNADFSQEPRYKKPRLEQNNNNYKNHY